MDKAVELARAYLPELADEVIGGTPYIITNQGEEIALSAGPSEINGDGVRVSICLFFRYIMKDKEKRERRSLYVPSSSHIIVEQLLGMYKTRGPTKEEFRQFALDTVLNYLTFHPLYPQQGINKN